MSWWGILLFRLLMASNLTTGIKLHSKEQLGEDVKRKHTGQITVLLQHKLLLFDRKGVNSNLSKRIN